jgi:hypothetical protein
MSWHCLPGLDVVYFGGRHTATSSHSNIIKDSYVFCYSVSVSSRARAFGPCPSFSKLRHFAQNDCSRCSIVPRARVRDGLVSRTKLDCNRRNKLWLFAFHFLWRERIVELHVSPNSSDENTAPDKRGALCKVVGYPHSKDDEEFLCL